MAETPYSPRLRTAVVLCGAGTAGAYHAGVLRALAEAGVKVDLVAGHGAGALPALLAAIDAGPRLWDPAGHWASPRLARAYRWRPALRAAAAALGVAVLALALPLVMLVAAGLVYVASLLAELVNLPGAGEWLVGAYRETLAVLFHPPILPTIVPRAIVLALLVMIGVLAWSALRALQDARSTRRFVGSFWWRLLGAPLDAAEPGASSLEALWAAVRGASDTPLPEPEAISGRYVETAVENFGQPGFREVLIAVHDLDARRDLVAALLPPDWQPAFETRRAGGGPREAETLLLTSGDRDLLGHLLLGACRLPVATDAHEMLFPADGYWRGEAHRLCDRPELATRLIDESARVGIEQVILVSAAAPAARPHGMRSQPLHLRSRMGELLRSIETAAFDDASTAAGSRFSSVFTIRPDHNPIGPFDVAGIQDEASNRHRSVAELLRQGHDDAYRQFIEPVVATGDRVGEI